jgi:hypothetical protein
MHSDLGIRLWHRDRVAARSIDTRDQPHANIDRQQPSDQLERAAAGVVAVSYCNPHTKPLNYTMAKRNYLVEGLSGVGKSSVYDELIRRGYTAISTDRAWAHSADPETGLPGAPVGHDTWLWDERKAVRELESSQPEVLFVCGSSRNSDRFLAYFTKVFNLCIDDDTMRRRLEARTDDDWPLGAEGVDLMLNLNRRGDRLAGAIDVDATRPLDQVVDELLRLADLANC